MLQSRIIYLIFLISSIIYASFFGGRVSHALFYLALILPIFCFAYTLYVGLSMKFYQSVSTRHIVKLEPAPYEAKINNEGFLPFIKIRITFKHDFSNLFLLGENKEYSLLPGECKIEQSELICLYRGEYSVGIKYFEVTGPFGLIKLKFPIWEPLTVIVYPRIIPWHYGNLLLAAEDEKTQDYFSLQKEEADAELRAYQPGDSLRQIHWKASAKMGSLLVHKDKDTVRQELLILPDFSEKKESLENRLIIEDIIIEELLSLTNEGLHNHIPVHIFIQNDEEFFISQQEDMDLFYEFCSKVYFSSKESLTDILGKLSATPIENTQLFLITEHISNSLADALLQIRSRVRSITILLTKYSSQEIDNTLISLLFEKGILVATGGMNHEKNI